MFTYTKYGKDDWVGKQFNDLTVIGLKHEPKRWKWICRCKCGSIKSYLPKKILTGNTKSCGCAKAERCRKMTEMYRIKHNGRSERLYHIWRGIKQRCLNETGKDYKNWGGRGISVCDEWRDDYAAFREWAEKSGYEEHLTIDRIDVNGNYCPENCRWITQKEQCRNKRKTVYVEYNGERKPLVEWCEELGLKYRTIYGRIHSRGWTVERSFEEPIDTRKRKRK